MATIDLYTYGVERGNEKIRYALSKQLPGDPVESIHCSGNGESIVDQFAGTRDRAKSKCDKPIAEMIHSFSPEESKKISPELVNKLGCEVASAMFPGHQILVVTHLDRGHYHNHIIMNRHHVETGKLARNDFRTLKKLRETNDRICREHGLSIPNQEKKEREARIPKDVAQMIKHGRTSYIADTMQKADFARSIATSYSQYQGILAEFGIEVRIEKKNISYSYPGRKVAKRGKTMGALYDKPGLEKAFKENDERFQKNPALRTMLAAKMQQVKTEPGTIKTVAGELAEKTGGHFKSGVKDYSKHEIVPRREARWARASEEELTLCLVPIDELRKARRANIITYCKDNGIKLKEKTPGMYVMTGRPYVEVSDYEWRNTKNNTRGSLIDLVAAHKHMTFFAAIAEINGNKRLGLLEKEIGEVKRTYTSFYIPKPERDVSPQAAYHLGKLLELHGAKRELASQLLKSGQAQVSAGGMIRLFGRDDEYGTLEFVKDDQGAWTRQRRGQFTQPFFSMTGGGRKVNVYVDPFAFMRGRAKSLFPEKKESVGTLALMEPEVGAVDRFLSGHRNVDTLHIVTADPKKPTQAEVDLFNNLKERYRSHGVAIEFISIEKAMPGRGLGLER